MVRSSLPLLELSRWRSDPAGFVRDLRHACHHVGFFQLRHDLPPGLVRRTFDVSRRFFALPEAQKLHLDYRRSPAFRGYMPSGVENTAGRPDRREQIEIAAEGKPAVQARRTP